MDDASFRNKTTTTKERRKDGSYLREFLDGVSRGVPRVPRHERVARESPNVLARSTQPSERERPKKRSTTVSSPKAAFLCVVERVVVVVPFFLPSFLLRHFSKRTKKNKQTNKLQTNEERNKHTKVLKIRTKYSRVAYLCA
jgi:hypothetical protein